MDFWRRQAKLKEAGNKMKTHIGLDWQLMRFPLKTALKVVKSATVLAKIIKNIKGHM